MLRLLGKRGGAAAPPAFDGTAMIAGDPGPTTIATSADAPLYTMPTALKDVSGSEWRMRWIVGAGVKTGSAKWALIGSNWFGVGSSAIYWDTAASGQLTIVHGGGSTTGITPWAEPVEGNVVDVGFDDAQHLTVRINGGTAVMSSGTVGSNRWNGYTELYLGKGPPTGSTQNGSPIGVLYPPRILADWWTL